MNLEPKAQAFVDLLAAANSPSMTSGTPQEARAMARLMNQGGTPLPLLRVEDHLADGPHGAVPVRLYSNTPTPIATILYLHGGGWLLGGIEESDRFARELAAESGCVLVSVGYRLAPEHPFPAGLDDSYAALEWVAANPALIAGRALPLVLCGDSAGGNLATVVAALALERRGPPVALQVLAYPVTDANFESVSYREFADGPLLTRELMVWFWDHYLADPARRQDPCASPLRRPSLTGLPPTFVLTAENDPLREEGEAYARRLAAAGIDVRLQRYAGQIHGFVTLVGMFDGTDTARRDIVRFIRERLAG